MNIGIYLDAVDFNVPSHYRLHTAILEGLVRKNRERHNFIVLTRSETKGQDNTSHLKYVTLRKDSPHRKKWTALRARPIYLCLKLIEFFEIKNDKAVDALRKWQHFQPDYLDQLKELEIDVMWFMTGIELPSPLPFIRTVLDLNHRIHPEYYQRSFFQMMEAFWASITKASFLITGTNEGKRQIVSLYNVYEDKVRVIPFPTPFLPDSKDLTPLDLGFKEPYVFYPARFWRHKNHVLAIEALKVLRDKWNIKINLVFSGIDGKNSEDLGNNVEYVMNYAQKLGVRDQVKHVGEVSLLDLTSLYKHALALAYVSATGPDNLPPLEAMSVGCPAIVADVPGAREQYGDASLFFHPTDENALAEHIKFMLENPAARQALIEKGFARAKSWTTDDYAGEVISLFDEFARIARAWGSSSKVFV